MVEKAGLTASTTMIIIILALMLWGGYQVYDDIKHPMSLYTIPLNSIQQLQCKWAAEGAVKQVLKAPLRASFHYDRVKSPHHNEDGTVTVEGYVDAQNDRGAKLRNPFKVILNETFNDVLSVYVKKN